MDSLVTIIIVVIALIAGAALGWFIANRAYRAAQTSDREAQSNEKALADVLHQQELTTARSVAQTELQQATAPLQQQIAQLQQELAAKQVEAAQLAKQLETLRSDMQRRETESNEQGRMRELLTPVADKLNSLSSTVAELETQRAKQHGEIINQLRQSTAAEAKLHGTAEKLAAALSSNTVRGSWGEQSLRRMLENSGLIARVDFYEQLQLKTDGGSQYPDVTIKLPEDRFIAVDAKAPMQQLVSASDPNINAEQRKQSLQQHAKALRGHIDKLAERKYFKALPDSPELVIAYVPSDGILYQALEVMPDLLEYGYKKQVALVSPVGLWSVLQSIAHTWRKVAIAEDAHSIYELGHLLYQRLGVLAKHIDDHGKHINKTVTSYNALIGSLDRSIVPVTRKLAAYEGSTSIKSDSFVTGFVEADESTRKPTARELQLKPETDTADSDADADAAKQ